MREFMQWQESLSWSQAMSLILMIIALVCFIGHMVEEMKRSSR